MLGHAGAARDTVATEAEAATDQMRQQNLATTRKMRAELPKNRDLIRKIVDYGLQTI